MPGRTAASLYLPAGWLGEFQQRLAMARRDRDFKAIKTHYSCRAFESAHDGNLETRPRRKSLGRIDGGVNLLKPELLSSCARQLVDVFGW